MEHIITEPFAKEKFAKLHTGDTVRLSKIIFTARDTAHRKLVKLIEDDKKVLFDINNAIIYYMGPTPPRPGYSTGSAVPTTSYRMDSFTPKLIEKGLLGMIGKGPSGVEVKEAAKAAGAIYFAAIGGAAALIAQSIKSSEIVAFADLGTEAIHKIRVENMPLVVALDGEGKDIYCG